MLQNVSDSPNDMRGVYQNPWNPLALKLSTRYVAVAAEQTAFVAESLQDQLQTIKHQETQIHRTSERPKEGDKAANSPLARTETIWVCLDVREAKIWEIFGNSGIRNILSRSGDAWPITQKLGVLQL